MALPWLESLSAFAESTSPAPFPKRFAALFMGNGVNEDHWDAQGAGADMKLSKTLAPLEPLKHKINVLSGFTVQTDGKENKGHQTGPVSIRTGTAPSGTTPGTHRPCP